MASLIGNASGEQPSPEAQIQQAREAWQRSMTRRLETLRSELRRRGPEKLALRTGAELHEQGLRFEYWGSRIQVGFPDLAPQDETNGTACSTFDSAILLYYLHTADGTPFADRWIGFRELPDGGFYHQAFQGYSGDRLAKRFGERPREFEQRAHDLKGWPLPALSPQAFAFNPLPRIRLAAVLWPGDEDFPSKAAVLFDAASSHYMPTDGLALLGAGLAGRMLK